MMKIRIRKLSVLFSILLILAGCSGEIKVYEKYHTFEDLSWNRFDFLDYHVELEDTETEYDIYVAIRHIPEIPYEEMLISLTIWTPSGVMRSANHTLDLVDIDDKRLSECLGDLCDIHVLVRKGFTIREAGKFKFEIENKFTKVEMPGIMEVGLIVKKAKDG